MIPALLAASLAWAEPACGALDTPPDGLQVAWVSRLMTTVGRNTPLQVMRVADLRKAAETYTRDPGRLLQALGLLGRKQKLRSEWKVTVFDVKRDQLCRPMDAPEGTSQAGMSVCPADWQHPGPGTRHSAWSGCGYLLDTVTGTRTVDVFRITWAEASSRGFCVFPLTRFVSEG